MKRNCSLQLFYLRKNANDLKIPHYYWQQSTPERSLLTGHDISFFSISFCSSSCSFSISQRNFRACGTNYIGTILCPRQILQSKPRFASCSVQLDVSHQRTGGYHTEFIVFCDLGCQGRTVTTPKNKVDRNEIGHQIITENHVSEHLKILRSNRLPPRSQISVFSLFRWCSFCESKSRFFSFIFFRKSFKKWREN